NRSTSTPISARKPVVLSGASVSSKSNIRAITSDMQGSRGMGRRSSPVRPYIEHREFNAIGACQRQAIRQTPYGQRDYSIVQQTAYHSYSDKSCKQQSATLHRRFIMLGRIAIHLGHDEGLPRRLRAALQLATEHKAELIGIYPPETVPHYYSETSPVPEEMQKLA